MKKRVFLIVLDSLGIGALPDAHDYGDVGANTLQSVYGAGCSTYPNLQKLGLFHIDGVNVGDRTTAHTASVARLACASKGKDTTIGHWELAGVVSEKPLPTYPQGFPPEILAAFSTATGRGVLCNKPYSGTDVIADFGATHMATGDWIVYTSADSVFQIAAHEEVVPLEELYAACNMARVILQGEHGVGRVIARPFVGQAGAFTRTSHRHDYSLPPHHDSVLNQLEQTGLDVIGVGKISDIFAGSGITQSIPTKGNTDGIAQIFTQLTREFRGLCFVNLVDFDMLYGHRNDVVGYGNALAEFDEAIPKILENLTQDDLLIITADHGCDPCYAGTDHSREYVPLLVYDPVGTPENGGTKDSFTYVSHVVKTALLG